MSIWKRSASGSHGRGNKERIGGVLVCSVCGALVATDSCYCSRCGVRLVIPTTMHFENIPNLKFNVVRGDGVVFPTAHEAAVVLLDLGYALDVDQCEASIVAATETGRPYLGFLWRKSRIAQ